jgi:hypothetical protein
MAVLLAACSERPPTADSQRQPIATPPPQPAILAPGAAAPEPGGIADAAAFTAPFCLREGMQFQFRWVRENGTISPSPINLIVENVEGFSHRIKTIQEGREAAHRFGHGLVAPYGTHMRITGGDLRDLWPLAVGNKVAISAAEILHGFKYNEDHKVTGVEEVSTPAGRFKTLRVESTIQFAEPSHPYRFKSNAVRWFALNICFYVKQSYQSEDQAGLRVPVITVLSSYTHPPRDSSTSSARDAPSK